MTASAIYEGRVRHKRHTPVEHAFDYRMFMLYLDLAELPRVLDDWPFGSARLPALAWFREADHLDRSRRPLLTRVRELVRNRVGSEPQGPIRLLTHLRYFGYVFNPVSFYYCFDAHGERVETIVAEVDNTPWGERHHYVLPRAENRGEGDTLRFVLPKAFHVSPFLGMQQSYDWSFAPPARSLWVRMKNLEADRVVFDATLALERRELTPESLERALLRYPVMTAKIVGAIYYNALVLLLKRAPLFAHPGSLRV